MPYIQALDRSQMTMFTSIDDFIESENPIRAIDILIDRIIAENEDMVQEDDATGRPRYHDGTMLKILIYSYLNRVRSSRLIERECGLNKELIWLTGGLVPDHWTIANYRSTNKGKIKKVTKLFRQFLKSSGYIKGKLVSTDGTKVKANAKRDMLSKTLLERRMSKIEENMEKYLKELDDNDRIEDSEEESGNEFAEKENELMQKIEKLSKEKEELSQIIERMVKEGKNYVSLSDWDANLMKTRNGKMAAYNTQIVIDSENKLIADTEVTTAVTDNNQAKPMMESLDEEIGVAAEKAIFDNGYMSLDEIEKTEKEFSEKGRAVDMYVSGQEKEEPEAITFSYNKEEDKCYCSEGKPLILESKNTVKGNSKGNRYRGIECNLCSRKSECTESEKGRTHFVYHNHEWRSAYKEKIESKEAKELLRKRKGMSEHPNGTLKWMMGSIHLLLRGKEKVETEINLLATCYNLKRLFNISGYETIISQIMVYKWQLS